jgi:hypothetical protein
MGVDPPGDGLRLSFCPGEDEAVNIIIKNQIPYNENIMFDINSAER